MTERRWADLATGKTYSYGWAPDVPDDECSNPNEIKKMLAERRVRSITAANPGECRVEYIDACENTRTGYIITKRSNEVEPNRYVPEIKKVIYNDPATIVFWADGTKTIVKKALAGNRGRYCNELEKFGANCKKDLVDESPFDRLIRHVREDIAEAGALIINKITHKTETEDGVEIKIELTGKK